RAPPPRPPARLSRRRPSRARRPRPPPEARNVALATRSFPALGTTAEVCVTDTAALDPVVAIVEDELAAIDLACSRFRDDSELAALNRAGGRPLRAGSLLIEALEVAIRAAEITDGDVDPTVGRAMHGLGWDCDFTVLV